jgi:hypothetical protein
VRHVVEIDKISSTSIDSADAQPGFARIDPVEIYETLKRTFERLGIVEARRLESAIRVQPSCRVARSEEVGHTLEQGHGRAHVVEEPAREVAFDPKISERGGPAERVHGNLPPEGTQLLDPLGWGISGNDRRIDRANRNPGNPIGMQVGFGERFVDTGLIEA